MNSDQISKKIGKLINEIDRSLEKKEQDKAVQVADADLIFMKMELSKMKISIETNEFSTTKKKSIRHFVKGYCRLLAMGVAYWCANF